MNKLQLAEWLAVVSWRKGANTLNGKCPTLKSWVDYYMRDSLKELKEEYQSYMC